MTTQTTGGVTKTFNYDAFNRMTSVVQGQSTLQSMTYGPDSKRLSLTDASGTRKFFYDGNDVIQEYDSNWSTVTKEYTHGPWIDEPLSMTDKTAREAGDTYYLMKDRLGSIINILDENETLKTTYSYDAFGEPTATHHSGQVDCMYRFTGRVYDGAMGAYFYRARYDNQSLGRFFSRDPIFSLQSLYAYCNNSPTNFKDPFGMLGLSIGGDEFVPSEMGFGLIWHRRMTGLPCSKKGDKIVINGKTYTSTGEKDEDGAEKYVADDGETVWVKEEEAEEETSSWSVLGAALTVAGFVAGILGISTTGGIAIAGVGVAVLIMDNPIGGEEDHAGEGDPKGSEFDPHNPRWP